MPRPLPLEKRPGRAVKFKLDSSFFDALWTRLQEQREKENKQWAQLKIPWLGDIRRELYGSETLPNRKQLENLVEAAFWVSLRREEGRTLKFTLAYGSPSLDTDFKFSQPKSYSVETISKLAPAVGNQIAQMGVNSSEAGELQIWGLNFGSSALRLTTLDPGQLIIKFVFENIAAISGNEAVLIRAPHLILSPCWDKFAPDNPSDKYSSWSDRRVRLVLTTLRTMRSFDHGGVLVVVPNNNSWSKSLSGVIPYEADKPCSVLGEIITTLNDAPEGENTESQVRMYESYLDTLAQALASLTAVDGATLVTFDLDIVGFGAKFCIRSEATSYSTLDQSTLIVSDPLDHENHTQTIGLDACDWGMRHRSAAQFIVENHDAVAFVVSQDGDVTAFVWEEWGESKEYASLVAYTHLDLTMF